MFQSSGWSALTQVNFIFSWQFDMIVVFLHTSLQSYILLSTILLTREQCEGSQASYRLLWEVWGQGRSFKASWKCFLKKTKKMNIIHHLTQSKELKNHKNKQYLKALFVWSHIINTITSTIDTSWLVVTVGQSFIHAHNLLTVSRAISLLPSLPTFWWSQSAIRRQIALHCEPVMEWVP